MARLSQESANAALASGGVMINMNTQEMPAEIWAQADKHETLEGYEQVKPTFEKQRALRMVREASFGEQFDRSAPEVRRTMPDIFEPSRVTMKYTGLNAAQVETLTGHRPEHDEDGTTYTVEYFSR
jgi:hypothetical protein